jgi:hypothetical protein
MTPQYKYSLKSRQKYRLIGRCRCSRILKLNHAKCEICVDNDNRCARKTRYNAKSAILEHYNSKCICGEANPILLTVDHINMNGKAHRQKLGLTSLCRWLVINNFPPGFQILCWNCNYLKYINSFNLKDDLRCIRRNNEALRVKTEVINNYGGSCRCCNINNITLLTIDHINENGANHRRTLKGTGTGIKIYRYLRQNNFPLGYQVLCMSCNWGKHINNGICPHRPSPRQSVF